MQLRYALLLFYVLLVVELFESLFNSKLRLPLFVGRQEWLAQRWPTPGERDALHKPTTFAVVQFGARRARAGLFATANAAAYNCIM